MHPEQYRTMAKVSNITISKSTGLTATQERACTLLASGSSVTDVATELGISRATLYLWQKQTTFICYFNKQRKDTKDLLTQSLFGLAQDAFTAIRECLQSTNEQVKLKAAMWITERLSSVELSETDIVEVAKAEATYKDTFDLEDTLHEEKYKERLSEYGVEEPDYQSTLK